MRRSPSWAPVTMHKVSHSSYIRQSSNRASTKTMFAGQSVYFNMLSLTMSRFDPSAMNQNKHVAMRTSYLVIGFHFHHAPLSFRFDCLQRSRIFVSANSLRAHCNMNVCLSSQANRPHIKSRYKIHLRAGGLLQRSWLRRLFHFQVGGYVMGCKFHPNERVEEGNCSVQ